MLYLLERLSVRPRGADGKAEAFDEEAAIVAQIQRIVATWRRNDESIAAVPWGMQSVVEIGQRAKGQLELYAERLRNAIVRYEPRLRGVHVSVESSAEAVDVYYVLISGSFPGEDQPRSIRVQAQM
ncbi:MAG TPA: GPW/gp25 family protein [Rhodocyclaceae bacterium]|nr:GPW/gp25 family protein [Rhodocyclaceae bacterium]